MGLLDVLKGMQNGPHGQPQPSKPGSGKSGGMSPLMMALLGLLAYKALKGSGSSQPSPAPAGTGKASSLPEGGGLGDILGGMLGGKPGAGAAPGGPGGLGDILGGMLGGGKPGAGGVPGGSGLWGELPAVDKFAIFGICRKCERSIRSVAWDRHDASRMGSDLDGPKIIATRIGRDFELEFR